MASCHFAKLASEEAFVRCEEPLLGPFNAIEMCFAIYFHTSRVSVLTDACFVV